MKKLAVSMGVTTLFVLLFAQFAPAAAVTLQDITGYSLENDKFAVTLDMNQDFYSLITNPSFAPDANRIQMTGDLLDSSNSKIVQDTTYTKDDQEFYMAYANKDGIQAAYNALMKFEHNVSAAEPLDIFWDELNLPPAVDTFKSQILGYAAQHSVGYVNATAPFQALAEHWRTLPDPNSGQSTDFFVTNNYVALMAYTASAADPYLGPEDQKYLGYTFAFNYFRDAVNTKIEQNTGTANFVKPYNAEPFFRSVTNGYEFGIKYSNLFVIWQAIPGARIDNAGTAVIYGDKIVAASLLDSLTFTYTFTTRNLGPSTVDPSVEEIHGDIQAKYDFGKTNLLIIRDDTIPSEGTWDHSFALDDAAADYVFPLPQVFVDIVNDIPTIDNFPTEVTVPLPSMAFYLNEDAQRRIGWYSGGYGMAMTTMTNTFAVGITPTYPTGELADPETIDILSEGEKAFTTTFSGKYSYTLDHWNNSLDGSYDVEIDYLPRIVAWNVGKFYFALEIGLLKVFGYILAKEMGLDTIADQGRLFLEDHSAYYTLTQYWKWDGGAIEHDPTYTAISGKAEEGDGTGTATESSAGDFVPGFEFLVVALAAIPLFIYKKRK
ncbi:MAG: hypothetical protein ACFFB3_19780 [Candidatus Hodarchaeota archaeon]